MLKTLFLVSTLSITLQGNAAEPSKKNLERAGFMVIEEEVVTDMRELPLELLQESKKDFSEHNYGQASRDISTAAKIIKSEGQRSVGSKTEMSLSEVSQSLDKLAKDVNEQKIKSENELSSELARAAYHAANHHRNLAIKEWSKKEYKQAGHDLRAAANATERTLSWSGKEMEKGTDEAIKGARDVAGKLIEGAGWTSSEVGNAFDKFGKATENLGKKIL